MKKLSKNKLKLLSLTALILLMIVIIIKIKVEDTYISKVEEKNVNFATIKVKSGSKIIKVENNENGIIQENSEEKNNLTEEEVKYIKKEVNVETKDNADPNNVENIKTKILEDNMLININKPKDNGTKYKYIIKNKDKEDEINFYSESGIKGYGYEINNNKEEEKTISLNKLEESPIVLENIDYSKDYYLHINTYDNANNVSNVNTFKIDLPSKGIRIRFLNVNDNSEVREAKILKGNANEDYNIQNDLDSNVDGFTLISNSNNLTGKFQKELINVVYYYAKNVNYTFEYIDKETGNKIINDKNYSSYEGNTIDIEYPRINGYTCIKKDEKVKLKEGNNIVKIYYEKNKEENENKNIDNIKKSEENKEESNKENDETKKLEKTITVRYVDITTNKELYVDKIVINSEDKKFKLKVKNFEGYELMENNSDNNNDEEKDDDQKESQSIIDELIESEYGISNISEEKSEDELFIKDEYEILMNCDESNYILYYKKK